MTTTFTLSQQFVRVTCGHDSHGPGDFAFAMTRKFYNETQDNGRTWYCPLGHPRVWTGLSTEQKLERAEAQLVAKDDQLRAAIRDAETTRVKLLRDRQRYANGVCPCCSRYFPNVHRHMATKHPEYDAAALRGQPSFKCGCGLSFESFRGLRTHQGHMRGDDWDKPGLSRWYSHLTLVPA